MKRSQQRKGTDLRATIGFWFAAMMIAAILSAGNSPVRAAELVTAQISRQVEAYSIHTEVLLTGSPGHVRKTLIQYSTLPTLHPHIEEVVMLPRARDGQVRVKLRTKACFLIFCQRYRWVQRVSVLPDGQVFAVIETPDSDFHFGWFRYQFVPDGERCRLILEARLSPKAGITNNWLVGAAMRHVLADEALALASRLEKMLAAATPEAENLPTKWRG